MVDVGVVDGVVVDMVRLEENDETSAAGSSIQRVEIGASKDVVDDGVMTRLDLEVEAMRPVQQESRLVSRIVASLCVEAVQLNSMVVLIPRSRSTRLILPHELMG